MGNHRGLERLIGYSEEPVACAAVPVVFCIAVPLKNWIILTLMA
jgi:hypothetical protein